MGLVAAGLYAPTSEEHFDDDLPVHGDMPASMNGVYVRVGPVRLKSSLAATMGMSSIVRV